MTDKEKVLKRLKDTLAVLTGKNVITNLDFQIRDMVEDCIRVIQTQQEEIEDCKKCVLRDEVHNYIEEIEKKDTLINTMQAEFERLEDLEDNTDMLKLELQKKDKIIDEMATTIVDEGIFADKCQCKIDADECDEDCEKCIKEYFINKVEKENKDAN